MRRMVLAVIVSLLIVPGCYRHSDLGHGSDDPESKMDVVSQVTKMPAEMPEDFNFFVSFGYGEVTKNEINTYQDTVTKDLIMKGTATASITISNDEMRIIYVKMREMDIMGMKGLSQDKQDCFKTPSNIDSWKITVDGKTKTFSWTDQNCSVSHEANQLLALRTFIQHIVEGKDAYKALPAAEGGYD